MISQEEFKKKIHIVVYQLQAGLFDEVIADAKKLLNMSNDQVIINILSLAYQGKGDFDNSIEILKKFLQANPKNIFFLNNIGLSYFKKHELDKAEYYYKRAIDVNPNYLNILNNYGNLKKELNFFEEALEYFKKAFLLESENFEINYNLGSTYQALGEELEAIKYFEKALKINPNFTKIDRHISSMINYDKNNKHFITLKKKILNKKLKIYEKLEINFALGKAYEDMKDYKNAFINIEKGNTLMKNFTEYNINADEKLFKDIKKFFINNSVKPAKKNKIKTIFILGMPRSGTSLVEQIISSHEKVFGGGELDYLNQIVTKKILNNSDKLDKIFAESQDEYISKISFRRDNLINFTDKSPLNFRWIGFILNILPNSKIIHCQRDMLEVCWSNYKNQFDQGLYYSNDLNDLTRFYHMYDDLMKFWGNKFPKKIYNLDYEALVNNPEETIREMIKFCQLDWDDNCLKHHENKRGIKTVSFKQARKPIYKTKIKNSSLYADYLGEFKKSLLINNKN